MEKGADGKKVGWERRLEGNPESDDDGDLDLDDYYFRKTGVRIFNSGRIVIAFNNVVDFEVDLDKEKMIAIRLPCSHFIINPRKVGRAAFRLSEMVSFSQLECKMPIVKEYPVCGHKLILTCTEFRNLGGEQVLKICPYRCQRKDVKKCSHPCGKTCGEDCDPCLSTTSERVPSCPLRHYNDMLCCVAGDKEAIMELRCMEEVFPRENWPSCDHIMRVKCFEAETLTVEELDRRCDQPCKAILKDCGHKCSGDCASCFAFRLHKKCSQKCTKLLICDHQCLKTCGEGCGPCERSCFRSCAHKRCQLECGVPCRWDCDLPCDYACEHGQCTMKCGEACSKAPCQEPCPLKIPECGHACAGFCGEPCPPLCRYCTPEKLADGALLSLGEVEEDDRFIYLEGCGHCVESTAMDQWMNVKDEEGQIVLKRCPICRSRLVWMNRYSEILRGNWDAIESVKRKIFGDEGEIEEALKRIENKIVMSAEGAVFYPQFLFHVWNKIDRDDNIGCRRADMSWSAVRWVDWIVDEFAHASRQAEQCAGLEGFDGERRWRSLFWVVGKREWPLENSEMIAFFREKQRLDDFTKVCRVLKEARSRDKEFFSKTFSSESCRQNYGRMMKTLNEVKSYDPACQDKFDEDFRKFSGQMQVTLALSDEERVKIVEAFGGENSGRWFKCPNGHVYVITECAGAISLGQCPECREVIGGLQHRVLENNFLAVEMDGASEPAYERVVRRDQERIREVLRRDQRDIQLAVQRNREEAERLALRRAREDRIRRIRNAVAAAAARSGNQL